MEDKPDVAEVTAQLLEQIGHAVTTASSAAAALRLFAESAAHRFDLVISDIVMAGEVNGLGLARRLRSDSNTPVLLVTGYSREAEAIGDEFPVLAKPYELADLARAIHLAVGAQSMAV